MADTTPTLREAAQQALEALEALVHMTGVLNAAGWATGHADAAVKALRAALAEQAAEQAAIPPAFAHAASQQMAVTSEWCRGWDDCRAHILSTAPAAEQAEPVAVPASIVAGAIFDFAGFLTTHKCVIKVGSTANASPVVERIKEWAGLRGLPIDDADVLSWQKNTAPPAPARQEPLTDERIDAIAGNTDANPSRPEADYWRLFARAIERAHNITAAPAEGGAAALTQPEGGA